MKGGQIDREGWSVYLKYTRTMKEKHISSYELAKRGFPRSTYYAIKQGKSVTTNTINQLCSLLCCNVSDIMEYIEDTTNL